MESNLTIVGDTFFVLITECVIRGVADMLNVAQIISGCPFTVPTTCIPTIASLTCFDPLGTHLMGLVLSKSGTRPVMVMYLVGSSTVLASIQDDFTSMTRAEASLNFPGFDGGKAKVLTL